MNSLGVLETSELCRSLIRAHQILSELKGRIATFPNRQLLTNLFSLSEAKAIVRVEGILAPDGEIAIAEMSGTALVSEGARETARCSEVLKLGCVRLREMDGILTSSALSEMYGMLAGSPSRWRGAPATGAGEIALAALVRRFNDDEPLAVDPLIKMALVRHQAEASGVFVSHGGRMAKVLAALHIVRTHLLDVPVPNLGVHMGNGGAGKLHQAAQTDPPESWACHVAAAVAASAQDGLSLIRRMLENMRDAKAQIRAGLPKMYSQALVSSVFCHPCSRIDSIRKDLLTTRQTATKYLDALAGIGVMEKRKLGRDCCYVNVGLVRLLSEA